VAGLRVAPTLLERDQPRDRQDVHEDRGHIAGHRQVRAGKRDCRECRDHERGWPPGDGVRAALWIKETVRDGWLGSMKMKNPPELPEQALIDPTGRVRCVIEGALEDADYAPFAAYLSR